jgi:beta-glucosidase-like glycosyl hydrolase
MQDLVDSYLAPFQACVEKGHVSGLMCSYNAINGKPTCADSWLLQEVARDTWGFDGYITSDCGAEADVFDNHHFNPNPEESVRDILTAGTDSDCGGFLGEHAMSALKKGLVTEADFDARLANLFRVRMRLSHFDPLGPLNNIPATEICSPAAIAMARCALFDKILLSRMPLVPMPARLKRVCVQPMKFLSSCHSLTV